MNATQCDVLVIGAGPAGSSAAAVLARHGHSVRIAEKEVFPRYRIGESLIPYCWYPLERLELIEKLDSSDFVVRKHSVQFISVEGVRSQPFYFFQHMKHDSACTWQVVRASFDQMLLDRAVEWGAEVWQPAPVHELIHDDGRVVGVRGTREGTPFEVRARLVIDASGRDAVSQVRQRWRVPDPELRKVAIWTYAQGAKRDPGIDEGATTIAYLPEKGWFWYLPLAHDRVSVGVVAEREYLYRDGSDIEQILRREAALQPWIRDHLAPGKIVEPCRVTGEYSYRSRHSAVDGLVLAGDAFSFLDPVFSSGVFLALQSGVMVADAAHEALVEDDVSCTRFASYTERFIQGIEAMRRLVYAFYDQGFNFADFLKVHPDYRGDITDCLVGNVERDLEPLFAALSDYANIPAPLPHGRPCVGEAER